MNQKIYLLSAIWLSLFSTYSHAGIRSTSEINSIFFTDVTRRKYVFDDASFASDCADFFERYKTIGIPSFAGGASSSTIYSSALSECLIQRKYGDPKIDSRDRGIDESQIPNIPDLMPATFMLSVSNETEDKKSSLALNKKSLKEADSTISYIKRDGEEYVFRNADGIIYIFNLFGSFSIGDSKKLYIINVSNRIEGGSYNSSRYFILSKSITGSFLVHEQIEAF